MHRQHVLASAFGAGIGTLVCLEMATTFWWVGLLVGAIIGYLTHNPIETWAALRGAAEEVDWNGATRAAAKKTRESAKSFGWVLLSMISIFFSGALCAGLTIGLVLLLKRIPQGHYTLLPQDYALLCVLALFVGVLAAFMSLLITCDDQHCGRHAHATPRYIREHAKSYLRATNPWAVLLIIGKLIWLAIRILAWDLWIWLFGVALPVSFKFLWRITAAFFRILHSDEKLISACDAAIGTAIGYWFGHVLLGFAAGGIVGKIHAVCTTTNHAKAA